MGNKATITTRKRDEITSIVAEIHGVSARYVQMVRNGERENEQILASVMDLLEGKNKLIESVKQLVPLDKKPEKRRKTTLGSIKKGFENGSNVPDNSTLRIDY